MSLRLRGQPDRLGGAARRDWSKLGAVQILGHRGSRRPGPDNTPSAVRAALAGGADGCEVDIRRSFEEALVCVHDPLVAGRPVHSQTLEELAAAGVYPFADVFRAAAGGRLVIEVKNDPHEPDYDAGARSTRLLVAELAELVGSEQALRDVVASSFDEASLRVAHQGGMVTGLLTRPLVPISRGLARAVAGGHSELHAHVSVVAATRSVEAVHTAGLRLVVWTVKTASQARRLRDLGVDAVICDDPVEVAAELDPFD